MSCQEPNRKSLKTAYFIFSILLFGTLFSASFIHADEGIAEINPAAESKAPSSTNGKTVGSNVQLTSKNHNEIILSIGQRSLNTYVNIRVPIPEGLVLAKSDIDSRNPRLTYVSSLDSWRAFNKLKSGQTFTGDLLLFDISTYRLSGLQEAKEQIQFVMRNKAVFFGNIPDTYMGFKSLKKSANENIDLLGFTKIDDEYVAVYISLSSQVPRSGDLEIYKKMMEEYFLELRKINNALSVTHENKPVKKCRFPGGVSVSDAGESVFTFMDCVSKSIFEKKVPAPAGFKQVDDGDNDFSKFTFVSDLETWKKYEGRKIEEPFREGLVVFYVAKHSYLNNQEARDSIPKLFMEDSGEMNTFGDIPDTYMVYHSFPSPVCAINLMGNTKINDEYVQVFINATHGCSPDRDDDDAYKKMMIDYMRKVREVNDGAHQASSKQSH